MNSHKRFDLRQSQNIGMQDVQERFFCGLKLTSTNTLKRLIHDPVTRYKISHAGTQVTQWNFQNKRRFSCNNTKLVVLEDAQCYLRPVMVDFVQCNRVVQRTYSRQAINTFPRQRWTSCSKFLNEEYYSSSSTDLTCVQTRQNDNKKLNLSPTI